jgi:hypothetical protein
MVAILIAAATTPVDIPTGMTTYGLDIVVKFDAVRCRLWRKLIYLSLFSSRAQAFTTEGSNIQFLTFFFSSRTYTDCAKDIVAAMDTVEEAEEEATQVVVATSTASPAEVINKEATAKVKEEIVCLTLVLV